MTTLGNYFDDPKQLATHKFNLSPAECKDITNTFHKDGTQAAVVEALKVWRRVSPTRATVRALVDIALSSRNGEAARNICRYYAQQKV